MFYLKKDSTKKNRRIHSSDRKGTDLKKTADQKTPQTTQPKGVNDSRYSEDQIVEFYECDFGYAYLG